MRWVGLDLHKGYITACALEDAGKLVAEHRRLAPDVDTLTTWFKGLGGAVTVAMEATLHWAWPHDQLSTAGIAAVAPMHLAGVAAPEGALVFAPAVIAVRSA